jgi:hypothetical protein
MSDEKITVKEENIYDRIRREAREKRAKAEAEQKKTDEYFARIKSGYNPLDEINQILTGELNK